MGAAARFLALGGLVADEAGNVYAIDGSKANYFWADGPRIRRITPSGTVSTLAGAKPGYRDGPGDRALFATPRALAFDPADGSILVADEQAQVNASDSLFGYIRRIAF